MEDHFLFEDNIFKEGELFIIIKQINGKYFNFGSYSTLEEAIEVRNDLNDCGWPLPKDYEMISEVISNISFPVSLGISSYNHRMWSIKRSYLTDLIPHSKYEKESNLIIDGIPVSAKLNLLTRLVYSPNENLYNYLKDLHEKNVDNCTINMDLTHGVYRWNNSSEGVINFETRFSKSFKQNFFSFPRFYSKNLFNILPYERKCNFFVNDKLVEGKFNIEPRLKLKDKSLIKELEESKEDNENIKIQFLI